MSESRRPVNSQVGYTTYEARGLTLRVDNE
jgi:hypothetical protein